MKANLKAMWAVHFLLEEFNPPVKDIFSLWIELTIGSQYSESGDYFRLFVCTPEWLSQNYCQPELIRHMLLVRKYDLDEIKKTIMDYIDHCEGENWMEIAHKLSRVFAWEYEDYQP